jgi:putative transposase
MLNFCYRIKERDTAQLEVLMETSLRIWNYALMLHRKYYEWHGTTLPEGQLKSYIAKKRKNNPYWQKLNSQAVQEIIERIYESYQRFFKKLQIHPPQFKSRGTDMSFCFKQCGYKIDNDRITVNSIGTYRFLKHRAYPKGQPKTVRIKRYNNRFYVILCCECQPKKLSRDCNGTVGIDFGLKTFITKDDSSKIESPRWLFKESRKLRKLDRTKDKKVKGSNRRKKAAIARANAYAKVKQRREAWQWEKANELCKQYAIIKIEDLCLLGMKRLWGHKVSDIAIGEFVSKLTYVAGKYDTKVIKVDRFYPSSHICHRCGKHIGRKLGLLERQWTCPHCGENHNRDINAAINIRNWESDSAQRDTSGQSADRSKTKTVRSRQRRTANKKPYPLG